MAIGKVDNDILKNPAAEAYLDEHHPDLDRQLEQIANGHHGVYVNALTAAMNRGDDQLVEKIQKAQQKSDLSNPSAWSDLPGMSLVKSYAMIAGISAAGHAIQSALPHDIGSSLPEQYATEMQNQIQTTAAAENSFSGAMESLTQIMGNTIGGPQMGMQQQMGMGGQNFMQSMIPGMPGRMS